jgi:peptidoglycan/LPS O-acetylase OafA/YrhL
MGHLWFLEQLMVFAAFYVIWRSIAALIAYKPARNIKIPGNHAIGVFALLLGVSMFIARIWSPINHWTPWLVLEPAHYTGYVALFIAGILAYRNGWLESMDASLYRVWGKAVVICLIALPVLYGVFGDGLLVTGGPTLASFIGSQWEAFMCVAMCISLIWLFKNRHNTTSKLSKAMADSSFTVYLIHVPVIVFIQFLLIGVDIHPLMKFAIVCAIGVPASFLISHYVIRKIPYVNRVF